MAGKSWYRLRGVVQPVLGGEPLVILLCKAFIANLRLILNVAMLVGAVLLAQQLRGTTDNIPVGDVAVVQLPAPIASTPEATPLNTDRIMHWQNCTRRDYRQQHSDDCDIETSEVYGPEHADPDDTGFLFNEPILLLASLGAPVD